MFHVRSYSVRLKKRNMETVSSFRRNLQRRRGGGGGANSGGGGGGGDGLNDSFRSKTSSRRRSTSLTTTTTGSLLNEQQQQQQSNQQQQQQCSSIKSPISSIDPQLQSKTINNEKETVTKIVKFNQPRQPTSTTKKKSFDKSNDDYQSENSKERLTFRRIR